MLSLIFGQKPEQNVASPSIFYGVPAAPEPIFSQSITTVQPLQYRVQEVAQPVFPQYEVQSQPYVQPLQFQSQSYVQPQQFAPAYQPIAPTYQSAPTYQPVAPSYQPIAPVYQPAAPQIQPVLYSTAYAAPMAPPPRRAPPQKKSIWEFLPFIPTLEPGQTVSDFEAKNRDFARVCTAASNQKPQGRTEIEAGLGSILGNRNVFDRPTDQDWVFRGRDIFEKRV
jgi:hypothetical protein